VNEAAMIFATDRGLIRIELDPEAARLLREGLPKGLGLTC
jgi:hypothetical protein